MSGHAWVPKACALENILFLHINEIDPSSSSKAMLEAHLYFIPKWKIPNIPQQWNWGVCCPNAFMAFSEVDWWLQNWEGAGKEGEEGSYLNWMYIWWVPRPEAGHLVNQDKNATWSTKNTFTTIKWKSGTEHRFWRGIRVRTHVELRGIYGI